MIAALAILPDRVEVKPLPSTRGSRSPDAFRRSLNSCETSPATQADLAIIAEYNRTWAGEILAATSGAATVVAFDGATEINLHHRDICLALGVGSFESWQTVHVDKGSRETEKYAAMLGAMEIDRTGLRPVVSLRDGDRHAAADLWSKLSGEHSNAIVCFPGSGEQLVRSLDAPQWVRWIEQLQRRQPVVLLGSEWDLAVLDEIAACGLPQNVARLIVPGDKPGVMAAFIESSAGFIGTDTGPMHVAAALGVPTLAVFGGGQAAAPLCSLRKRAAAIRMPIGCYGCDWLCPFDRRHCLKDIPEHALHSAGDAFLADRSENADPFQPRVFDIIPPAELTNVVLGPMMRQHRRFWQITTT